jgi:glutaredoxin-related protein
MQRVLLSCGIYFIAEEAVIVARQLLDERSIHPAIKARVGGDAQDTLDEVKNAIASNSMLVVGMAHNPHCKKVRKQLDQANISYRYLEYGSYTKEWQRRLSLKMWSGWPTFPMVFVNGQLLGGNQEVETLLASGELQQLLDSAGI